MDTTAFDRCTPRISHMFGEMLDLISTFGDIQNHVSRVRGSVKEFLVIKYAQLLHENVVCWLPTERERNDANWETAHFFSSTTRFEKYRIDNLSRRYIFLESHHRARWMKHGLPPLMPAGIGVQFLNNIEHLNLILLHLLRFSPGTREHLFSNVKLVPFLLNRYLGDDIWQYFRENVVNLPRPPYGAMR